MKEINTGLGVIKYEEPENLQLQLLMDALAAKLEKVGALEVERLLS